jgi:hypothetical protein
MNTALAWILTSNMSGNLATNMGAILIWNLANNMGAAPTWFQAWELTWNLVNTMECNLATDMVTATMATLAQDGVDRSKIAQSTSFLAIRGPTGTTSLTLNVAATLTTIGLFPVLTGSYLCRLLWT